MPLDEITAFFVDGFLSDSARNLRDMAKKGQTVDGVKLSQLRQWREAADELERIRDDWRLRRRQDETH